MIHTCTCTSCTCSYATGCPVVIHADSCRGQLDTPCATTSDKLQTTQENGVQRSAAPQQPAKGPLALVRRQIAK